MSIDEIRKIHYTEKGREEGIEKGKIEGKREDIIEILSDIGIVSEDLRKIIYDQNDIETLKQWIKLAARCKSIDEFKSNGDRHL